MTRHDIIQLDRLRSVLTEREAVSVEAVDTLGLLLAPKLVPSTYSQSPIDCVPFAYTGGDGVHFSFAAIGNAVMNSSPIIMTVPMCFRNPNRVVGLDLEEFLSLGLRTGYFMLEELQYAPDKWIEKLKEEDYHSSLQPLEIETLCAIERSFGLQPWANPERRLRELEAEFGPLAKSKSEN